MEVQVRIMGTLEVEPDDLARLKRDDASDVLRALLLQGRPVKVEVRELEGAKR